MTSREKPWVRMAFVVAVLAAALVVGWSAARIFGSGHDGTDAPSRTLVVFSGGETLAIDTTTGAVRHVQGPLKDVYYVPSPDGAKLVLGCGDDGTAYISADDTGLCMYDDAGYHQLTRASDLVRPGFVEDEQTTLEVSWSADSRRIAFLVRERAAPDLYSSGDIYVVDVTAGSVKRIAEGAFAELRGPMAWSPDGTRIAMRNSQRLALGDQLLGIDVASGETRSFSDGLPTGGAEQYAWAPDSSAIAFTWNDGGGHLYMASAAGGRIRDLGTAWGGTPPAWSPDGGWIAATEVSNSFARVFITKVDGSGRRLIGPDLFRSDHAAWAPDGEHLAFAGSRTSEFNDRHVFVTDRAGTTPRELASETTLALFPLIAFSDDGNRVLFTANAGACVEGCPPGYLYIVDVDGSTPEVRLTEELVGQFLGWVP